MTEILVLYYSRSGSTKKLAELLARGAGQVTGVNVKIRTVPDVYPEVTQAAAQVPEDGAVYVTLDDLASCDGLALGSPTRFGNIAAPLKYFLDSTSGLWMKGALVDKPATVFTSTASLHGGQESTLLSMLIPLLHHGMVILGVPYSEEKLATTTSGGTPYGTSHWAGSNNDLEISEEEHILAIAQGERLAKIAQQLQEK